MNMPLYQFLRKNLFTVHSATVLFFLLVAIDAYVCLTPPLHRENGTGKQAEVYRYASSASPRMELTGLDYDLNLKGETRVKLKVTTNK